MVYADGTMDVVVNGKPEKRLVLRTEILTVRGVRKGVPVPEMQPHETIIRTPASDIPNIYYNAADEEKEDEQ